MIDVSGNRVRNVHYAISRAVESDTFQLTLDYAVLENGTTHINQHDVLSESEDRAILAGIQPKWSRMEEAKHMDAYQYHRMRLLWYYMRVRETTLLARLWDKMEKRGLRDKGAEWSIKWPQSFFCDIGGSTAELMRFIIFHVRRPRLAYEMMKVDKFGFGFRSECVAMVAAIMDTLFFPGRVLLSDYEEDWWGFLLAELCSRLPVRPTPLWLYRHGEHVPISMTLLEVAVLSSHDQPSPIKLVLWPVGGVCRFSPIAKRNAWSLAIKHNTLRNDSVIPVLVAIYCSLCFQRRHPGTRVDADSCEKALEYAWQHVVDTATGWHNVHVCSTASGIVQMPFFNACNSDTRHPDLFLEIVDKMALIHEYSQSVSRAPLPDEEGSRLMISTAFAGVGNTEEVVRLSVVRLLTLALYSATHLGSDAQTHMVRKLLNLMDARGHIPEFFETPYYGARFLAMRDAFHASVYPILHRHLVREGTRSVRECHASKMGSALEARILDADRDGVRTIVALLGAAPRLNDHRMLQMLSNYITRMCSGPTPKLVLLIGAKAVREYNEAVKRDLGDFLNFGQYTADALQFGLKCAGRIKSGIAAEVLLSPPYNAAMPDDDPFIHNILNVLLAPGAEAVIKLGESFEKRQRCSL